METSPNRQQMKHKVIYLLFFQYFIFSLMVNAQQWAWGRKGGGSGDDQGNSIVGAKDGNLYTAGSFQGTGNFGSKTINSNGSTDAFVAKHDTSGNCLWVRGFGGTSVDIANGVGTDVNGNAYVIGQYQSTVTFGSGTTYTSKGSNDAFLSKYDINGNFLWAKSFGGTGFDRAYAIFTDSIGNCYVTGTFMDSVNINGNIIKIAPGDVHEYVAKFDSSGTCLWAKAGGGWDGYGVYTDKKGNCFITGSIITDVVTQFDTISLPIFGGLDAFIAKYSPSGKCLWVKRIGDINPDVGYSIAVDSSNNIYLSGYFITSTKIGNISLAGYGNEDIFIAKFDQQGNVIWAKKGGSGNYDWPTGIAIDKNGFPFITGIYSSNATFGTVNLPISGGSDVFVAKYDPNGNLIWVKNANGSNSDKSNAICVDNYGHSYITGFFTNAINFGTSLSGSGSLDFFIAKLTDIKAPQANFDISDTAICINNCINFTDKSTFNPKTWKWSFPGAIPSSSNNSSPSNICYYNPGTFTISLTVTNDGGTSTISKKITVQSKTFEWLKIHDGGTAQIETYSTCVDKQGNQYVTGTHNSGAIFCDTVLWGGGTLNFFIAKIDKNGNCIWVKNKGGGGGNESSTDIALDSSGNIYVSGRFNGSCQIDNFVLNENGAAGGLAFIAKFDPQGNCIWVRQSWGNSHDWIYALSIDTYQMCYITGVFTNQTKFGNFILNENNNEADIFLAKYDMNGNCLWAKQAGGSGVQYSMGVTCDSMGNPYITGYTGYLADTLKLDTISFTSDKGDAFIAKYSKNGNIIWAKQLGGSFQDWGKNISHDLNNRLYVAGEFGGVVNFDSITLQAKGANPNVYIACYSDDGKCLWAKSGSGAPQSPLNICSDGSGCINIGWFYSDTIFFDNYYAKSNGLSDMYAVKYDNEGKCLWLRSGGGLDNDYGTDIAIDPNGSIYFSGLGKTGKYGQLGVNEQVAYGTYDYIIGKMFGMANAGYDVSSCKSTSVQLNASGGTGYFWSPASGLSNTNSASVSANPLTSTTYTVNVTDDLGCQTFDAVKVIVNSLPNTSLVLPFSNICGNTSSILLQGGSPAGGYYTGNAVSGNFFNPQSAGNGYKGIITYNYTDSITGCTNMAEDSVYVETCTGIINNVGSVGLKVFPNPVLESGIISIIGNTKRAELTIEIYNNFGQLILKKKTSNEIITFNKTGYSNGIYTFILRDENNSIVSNQRVVVQ